MKPIKPPLQMKIFIFKTDIQSNLEMSILGSAFRNLKGIVRWSVDMQDIDRVLKVVTVDDTSENDFLTFVKSQGIRCETLPD